MRDKRTPKDVCGEATMFSVTSKAPNLERLTSEMCLDKGYFDRIYGTFLFWLC